MFGETTISYVKIGNHPIETTIYKWLFGVPGRDKSQRPSLGDFFFPPILVDSIKRIGGISRQIFSEILEVFKSEIRIERAHPTMLPYALK